MLSNPDQLQVKQQKSKEVLSPSRVLDSAENDDADDDFTQAVGDNPFEMAE